MLRHAACWLVCPRHDMEKIRFGVIGCGYIAGKAVIPALISSKYAELVAVADISKEKADSFSIKFGCDSESNTESLLRRDDIKAVYIATVPSSHEQIVLSAAKFGKHILCEKPLTVSYDSAKRMVDCSEKYGVGIFEGFMYQFHSQHQNVRALVDSGEIGRPVLFTSSFGFPPLENDNFRYHVKLGGGALLDAGSYTIHAARKFFKREPINAHSLLYNNGNEVEIHGAVTLDFGEGQTAQLSFGFNNFYRNEYSVWGTDGQVTVKRAFSIPATFEPKIILEKQDFTDEIICEADDHFQGEVDYFCMSIGNNNVQKTWTDDIIFQSKLTESIRCASEFYVNHV